MAGEHPPTLPEEITSPTAAHAQPSVTHAQPPQTPVAIPSALPPIVQSSSNPVDSVRITILEWMVNQLAANMATNMNELTALLRDQNQASSSYTPPPKNRQTMDLNPVVALTLVSESEEASFAVMTHVPAVYPVSDLLSPPPAPTAVPLPPAAFLSADSAVLPPTLSSTMNAPAPAHTIEPFPFQTS
ncbi:actin cytoskeleton-regulatory complex protein PAN1-like [Punica granatum]|uniref:Actin cytoskeleton-regulatory complex protein PAN1-like n=1 Tax=Punica granatum TaxID=22663 RepID=A0A6P8DLI0_PUNGR|nr:actin cytoskeleton-regulatory complex protein PAN1-like [Punica granatum]